MALIISCPERLYYREHNYVVRHIENNNDTYLSTLNPDFGKNKCKQIFKIDRTIFTYETKKKTETTDDKIKTDLEHFLRTIYSHGTIHWDNATSTFNVFERRGLESPRIHHQFQIRSAQNTLIRQDRPLFQNPRNFSPTFIDPRTIGLRR